MTELRHSIQEHLLSDQQVMQGAQLRDRVTDLVRERSPLLGDSDRVRRVDEVIAEIEGFGPLDHHARRPEVSEIMVNGNGDVYIDSSMGLQATGERLQPDCVLELARRLVATVGRVLDRSRPFVDARLSDGSRLHVAISPIAVDGPLLTIRRFVAAEFALEDYATPAQADALATRVREGENIVVAGATSSGKTSMLNALSAHIGASERVITIEEAAELRLRCPHVVRLEARPEADGAKAVDLGLLIRQALRMRPDRIICGEMRGAEAFDLIQAMNTGHAGSMSTVHASSAIDALSRIETLMLLARNGLPFEAVRSQLARSIDVVVYMGRNPTGSRVVREMGAVGRRGDEWRLVPIETVEEELR